MTLQKKIWNPISLTNLKEKLQETSAPFWIAGGVAIDLFIGRTTRPHDDLDVAIKRQDQSYFQSILLNWDLQACDPPGSGQMRPWNENEALAHPIHNIWCRKGKNKPWSFEIMLCEFNDKEWIYRRNPSIRGPIHQFGWNLQDGTNVIAPEIQLLYKSRNVRTKDQQDFENCFPQLDQKQRNWLQHSVNIDSGKDHPWLNLF